MITRNKVLSQAAEECLKELYSFAQPHIEWEDFIEENRIFIKREEAFENSPENTTISCKEYCGPKPFEFYYLPEEIMKDICNSYIHAYQIDSQQELLNTIQILKNYCKEPIVDKWIERENGHPGYRSYDHPDNLEKEINKIIDDEDISQLIQNKFFEFLDMAGNFFNWNRELNSFNMSIYFGASPNSNKEAVIENWKKYRNQDIEIDEEQIKKDYYGEDELD